MESLAMVLTLYLGELLVEARITMELPSQMGAKFNKDIVSAGAVKGSITCAFLQKDQHLLVGPVALQGLFSHY